MNRNKNTTKNEKQKNILIVLCCAGGFVITMLVLYLIATYKPSSGLSNKEDQITKKI